MVKDISKPPLLPFYHISESVEISGFRAGFPTSWIYGRVVFFLLRYSCQTASGRTAGVQREASPLRRGPGGCNPPGRSPEAAVSGQCPEVKPLGRVQGGSACWVSRGQSPLGRVQGDNACSGVQRVKPFGPGRIDARVNPYWVLPDALCVSGAGGFAAFLRK